MSQISRMEALFAALRGAEHMARAELIAGCEDDAAKIERFFERPLRAARREAYDALAGMGAISNVDLAVHLRREAFERLGTNCAEMVCANVGLRARARFRMYANALAEAEVRIADAIAATHLVPAKRPLPRMFAIGRIDLDDFRIPDPPARSSEVDDWIEQLGIAIRDEIDAHMKVALDRVLTHGFDRLGIIKTRIDLALCSLDRARLAQARNVHAG
jgi:hypothetical protein